MSASLSLPSGFEFLLVPYRYLPVGGNSKSILNMPWTIATIARYCRRHNVDIIHTHHRFPELAAVVASWLCGVRTVTTVHSLLTNWRIVSYRSQHIISVSDVVRRRIIEHYGREEHRVVRLYNPISPMPRELPGDVLRLKNEFGIPIQHRILLYVGRFDDAKGGPFLAEAFRSNVFEREELTLLMIGDPSRKTVGSEVLENGNLLIIAPPQEDVHRFYYSADVVILPSIVDAFPYVMLEAGLACRPFIGSNVDGIAEFIKHGENGLLFPPRSTSEMALFVKQILDDQRASAAMAHMLHANVKGMAGPYEYARQIVTIYHSHVNDANSTV